jgi:UDP-GlcNAc3NAcA epimerase
MELNQGKRIKVCAVIGARPQFIKHAPVELAAREKLNLHTIHTGQHYDYRMSQIFFDELGIAPPDTLLQAGGGMHGEMTGRMLSEIEKVLVDVRPDLMLVYGDTNSTLAGSLAAAKLNIPIIHVEAGLRSYNRSMPEEINRVLTDHLSAHLFAPTDAAVENLKKEGITAGVHRCGDVMCDMIRIARERQILRDIPGDYIYMTLHRPYNTDDLGRLDQILSTLASMGREVRFYVHPRTAARIREGLDPAHYKGIQFHDPLSYFDNLNAMNQSSAIITDSGGIQKEAYILRKKCITLRSETEWTETLEGGWNQLIWEDLSKIAIALDNPTGPYRDGLYGDGYAAKEMWDLVLNQYS